jgi:hypothetical protein
MNKIVPVVRLARLGPSKAALCQVIPRTSQNLIRNDVNCGPPVRSHRLYSSSTLTPEPVFDHPAINQLKNELTTLQPCFGVRGDEVDVMFEPAEFHKRLLVSSRFHSPGLS